MKRKIFQWNGDKMSLINKDKIISEENEYNVSEMADTKDGFDVTLHNPKTGNNKKVMVNNDSRYYTENEIDEKIDIIQVAIDIINGKIDSLVNFKIEVLEELPETGKDNVLYFIPKNKESPDTHDEYVWVNNAFEFIGTTEVDLTPYAKTEYVNRELEKKSNINHVHVKSDITDFAHNHDDRYYTESEINSQLSDKANSDHTHVKDDITNFAHDHDDRYYTETEIDNKLNEKSNVSYNKVISSGVKIGEITIDGNKIDVYAPSSEGGVTYDIATTTNNGLMSSEDKVKLNGIEAQANKTIIDDELNTSSQNPVKNSVITNELNNKSAIDHNHDDRYYTETETNTLLSRKANTSHNHEISDINNLQTKINTLQDSIDSIVGFEAIEVSSLPSKGENGIIYLIPKSGSSNDTHDEYVWVETTNSFELIGNTKIDLSDYYTKTQTDNLLNAKADTSTATTSANGLMSSTDKTKLDGISSSADAVSFTRSLTSGTKIGTININGIDTDLYCETDTKVTVDSSLSSTSTNPVQNKIISSALSEKANSSHTHTVSNITDVTTVPLKIVYEDDTEEILNIVVKQ